eukprot:1841781-Pyramimonas_sp.AAC.1
MGGGIRIFSFSEKIKPTKIDIESERSDRSEPSRWRASARLRTLVARGRGMTEAQERRSSGTYDSPRTFE